MEDVLYSNAPDEELAPVVIAIRQATARRYQLVASSMFSGCTFRLVPLQVLPQTNATVLSAWETAYRAVFAAIFGHEQLQWR